MNLRSIESIRDSVKIVLVYTTTDSMLAFLEKKLAKNLYCSREYIREIKSSRGMKEAVIDSSTIPIDSNCWLFKIDLDKKFNPIEQLRKSMPENISGVYFLYTGKYYMYKKILEDKVLSKYEIFDIYSERLNKEDMIYLYDSNIENNSLTKELMSYVVENYKNDIDSVFKLIKNLNNGVVFKSKKDIVKCCGTGGNTIQKFALSLVTSKTNNDIKNDNVGIVDEEKEKNIVKGKKAIIRNKTKVMNELCGAYSIRYIQTVLISTVSGFCDLKILYITGHLYKKNLDREALIGYDEKRVNSGMKFWYKIHELSLKELIYLKSELECTIWESMSDFELFLYRYYS